MATVMTTSILTASMTIRMTVVRAAATCASLLVLLAAAPSPVQAADAWGCNYDKCVAYCTKVSGKFCTIYCGKRLQEKRNAKVCQ